METKPYWEMEFCWNENNLRNWKLKISFFACHLSYVRYLFLLYSYVLCKHIRKSKLDLNFRISSFVCTNSNRDGLFTNVPYVKRR